MHSLECCHYFSFLLISFHFSAFSGGSLPFGRSMLIKVARYETTKFSDVIGVSEKSTVNCFIFVSINFRQIAKKYHFVSV